MKEPKIKQVEYDFYVDGKKHEYEDFGIDKNQLVVCLCKNKTFWIYQPQGMYETNAICTKCRRSYCVHDG